MKSCINISYTMMDVVWCASKDHSCQNFNVNSTTHLKDKQMEKHLTRSCSFTWQRMNSWIVVMLCDLRCWLDLSMVPHLIKYKRKSMLHLLNESLKPRQVSCLCNWKETHEPKPLFVEKMIHMIAYDHFHRDKKILTSCIYYFKEKQKSSYGTNIVA